MAKISRLSSHPRVLVSGVLEVVQWLLSRTILNHRLHEARKLTIRQEMILPKVGDALGSEATPMVNDPGAIPNNCRRVHTSGAGPLVGVALPEGHDAPGAISARSSPSQRAFANLRSQIHYGRLIKKNDGVVFSSWRRSAWADSAVHGSRQNALGP